MGTNLTGETWGVSGPAFLVVYVVLAAGTTGIALWWRSRIATGNPSGIHRPDGRPEDVAYLNGGPELAVFAALSAMHVDGTITTSERTTGQVRASGRPTRSTTALQLAVHRSARRLTPGRTLYTHTEVRVALEAIAHRLETSGLLLSTDARGRYRSAAVLPGVVAVLGVARMSAGAAGGRPIGYLSLLTLVVVVITVVLAVRVPSRTRAGDTVLRTVREEHSSLAPAMRPDWTAVGPAAAALSVGAFGVAAMIAAEPAFAEELAAQKAAALGGGGGGPVIAGGDGGGGSGSSCGGGGGGCGGGCGG